MNQDIKNLFRKDALLFSGIGVFAAWVIVSAVEVQASVFSIVLLALSILMLGTFAVFNIDKITGFFKKSQTQRSLQISAAMFFVTGILVLMYVLAARQTLIREDFTSNRRFSLSQQTLDVLDTIEQPIKFYIFNVEGSRFAHHAYGMENMLNEYRMRNRQITVNMIDMQEEPALAQTYNVQMPASVLIIYGAQTRLLTIEDYVHMKMIGRQPQQVPNYEASITSTLLSMTRQEEFIVYFTVGRGEKNVTSREHGGAAFMGDALENEGMVIKTTNLLLAQNVPDDCDLLVMAGPVDTMTPEEIAVIESWLEDGNPAVFLVKREAPGLLKQLLGRWGVRVGNAAVIDPERLVQGTPIIIPFYTNHDITKQLAEQNRFPAMLFPVDLGRSAVGDDPEWGTVSPLLRTSKSAWAETGRLDREGGLQPRGAARQEFNLAYAVERRAPRSEGEDAETVEGKSTRLAVIGDADFIVNGYITNFAGSKDFFLNTINWTLHREESITIRPKDPVSFPLNLTEQQMTIFFIIAVVLMPLGIVISGIMVFLKRRNHGK